MNKGDKFVIEIEDIFEDSTGKQYAKMKGFNTLIFDEQGIEKLTKFNPVLQITDDKAELAYAAGHTSGMHAAWTLAQRVAMELTIPDLINLDLISIVNDDLDEFEASCKAIGDNSVEEVISKVISMDK